MPSGIHDALSFSDVDPSVTPWAKGGRRASTAPCLLNAKGGVRRPSHHKENH